MNERFVTLSLVTAALAVAGCADGDRTAAAQTLAASEGAGDHPVTEWGDPDLQGMWPIGHVAGNVPLVRPAEYGERAFLTDEEYAEVQARLEQRAQAYEREIESDRIGMGHWAESWATAQAQQQTSLIVDPPDGQFPALTQEGERRAAEMGSSWHQDVFDGIEDFDTWDRCITRGLPASMFPFQYNNGIQILQSPGYVVLNLEMIHEARIIPVDGRPHLDEDIRQWLGDSRGRWEGNTLVIETTNFNGIPGMTNVGTTGSPRRNVPTSEQLRLVERLTRLDEDTLQYEITVEDPVVQTRPWTVAYTWHRDPDYVIFEYACHEGNETIRDYIETSRYEREQQAATR